MNDTRYVVFIQGKGNGKFCTIVNSELGTVEQYFKISKDDETRKYKPLAAKPLDASAADDKKNHRQTDKT